MLTVIFINCYLYWMAYKYGIKISDARAWFTQDEPPIGAVLSLIMIFALDMVVYFTGFFKVLSWLF